jgi:outer membrane protein assembly factor BamB
MRLWPGVVIAILQLVIRFVVPAIRPDLSVYGVLGSMACALAILLWWLLLSRAPWPDRLGALALAAVALFTTKFLVHESIATGGMGMLFYMLAVPWLSLALVAWAVLSRNLAAGMRRATMVATILVACGTWMLVRTGGFNAEFKNDLHWRWTPTPEEKLVAQSPIVPVVLPPPKEAPAPADPATKAPEKKPEETADRILPETPAVPAEPDTPAIWPGFRGPHRDSVIPGVRIKTDWNASPPASIWRRPVGPGWSSFAVRGDLIYTQEQRGPDEVVTCYKLSTGDPVWAHKDKARFWESNGGAGPRGTPTLSRGRVYTFGGTGILNALNARTGAVLWSHAAATDHGKKTPTWGFSSSPLIVKDLVVVAVSGQLFAYDAATSAPRWSGPKHGASYSSPQLATIGGLEQILQLSADGATGVGLDGKVLWEHAWKGYPIVQPALTPDGDVLISVSDSGGTRRLGLTHGASQWTVEERWTSTGLKPYFNDFVVHKDHAYGFDGGIMSCIDLKDGKRTWKGGRYGHGQLILLADQDLMLVTSEEGDLALVRAVPDQFTELARVPAIEGKMWNHPVLAGDVLLVRNGEQMAAYRLALAE